MDIKELYKIQERIKNIHNKTKINEEQTKTSLIMPMFMALGYDVFNMDEFVPEYTTDFGRKQGEKVDYAICINGQPLILVEAKKIGVELGKDQVSQLFRYYACTDARIAILTNGDDYWFFTDSVKANTMDIDPYLKLKLSESDEVGLRVLGNYSRENIEEYDVSSGVQMQKYESTVKEFIDMLFTGNISASFIEYMQNLSGVYDMEKSRMASIFDLELCRKFKIMRGKTEKTTEKQEEKASGKWDRSKMEEIDTSRWYVYNEVKWVFHKPSKIKLFNTEYEAKSFKQIIVILISEIINNNGTAKSKLLETFNSGSFIITEDKGILERGCTEIPGEGIYVGTALSGADLVRFIHRILQLFNCRDESLLVQFAS